MEQAPENSPESYRLFIEKSNNRLSEIEAEIGVLMGEKRSIQDSIILVENKLKELEAK